MPVARPRDGPGRSDGCGCADRRQIRPEPDRHRPGAARRWACPGHPRQRLGAATTALDGTGRPIRPRDRRPRSGQAVRNGPMALVILLGVTALVVAVMTLPGRRGQVTAARWRRALHTLRDNAPQAHLSEDLPDLYHAPEHVRVIPTRGRAPAAASHGPEPPDGQAGGVSAGRPPTTGPVRASGVPRPGSPDDDPGYPQAAADATGQPRVGHRVASPGPNSRASHRESGSVSEPKHDDARWSPDRRRSQRSRKGDRCRTIH